MLYSISATNIQVRELTFQWRVLYFASMISYLQQNSVLFRILRGIKNTHISRERYWRIGGLSTFQVDKIMFMCLSLFIRVCRICRISCNDDMQFTFCFVLSDHNKVVLLKSCHFIWGPSLLSWCLFNGLVFLPSISSFSLSVA